MRRLHPDPAIDVDPYEADRPRHTGPFVRINMVASVDGRVVGAAGTSGDLGGEGDRRAFSALRHHADVILVGAGTVRAEGYRGMRIRPDLRDRRAADGRLEPAPIAVVTASLNLDPTSPLFTDTSVPPIVLTTGDAPADRRAALQRAGATVVAAGTDRVDPGVALDVLRGLGRTHVLCEGGPSLNGALLGAGLVDEICVTLAPALVGGADPARIVARLERRVELAVDRVLLAEDELLIRYRVGAA